MRTLTVDEALHWVNSTGLRADRTAGVCLPAKGFKFSVRLPKLLPYQAPYFASLFLPGSYQELDRFLFWLDDNGASGELAFDIAVRLLEIFRAAHGEKRPILESPAYLFEPSEGVDARALVTMAVLFSWDAYIVPEHGRYYVWIDDDEFMDVCCRRREDFEELKTRFSEWGVLE